LLRPNIECPLQRRERPRSYSTTLLMVIKAKYAYTVFHIPKLHLITAPERQGDLSLKQIPSNLLPWSGGLVEFCRETACRFSCTISWPCSNQSFLPTRCQVLAITHKRPHRRCPRYGPARMFASCPFRRSKMSVIHFIHITSVDYIRRTIVEQYFAPKMAKVVLE
jgi:hypothetical protein